MLLLRLVLGLALLAVLPSFASSRSTSNGTFVDSLPTEKAPPEPREKWFSQKLDHFNSTSKRTWQQRYYMSEHFFRKNGPVFFLISGDNTVDPRGLTSGFMANLAKKFGAMCFTVEHRFYGKSRPTENLSLESLAYLTTDQVLEDVANFIREIQSTHNKLDPDTKWIVFGESYAGSIAAGMRFVYPQLVHGSVAGSAPIGAKFEFAEYYTNVEELFEKYSAECTSTIKSALKEVYTLLKKKNGIKEIGCLFKLCGDPFPGEFSQNDVSLVYIGFLTIAAMMTDKLERIKQTCDIMLDDKRGSLLHRYSLSDEWNDRFDQRQAIYQQCTEFGWFATTSARPFNSSMDAVPLEFSNASAPKFSVFLAGVQNENVGRANKVFEGTELMKMASRIIFAYGDNDPTKTLGILRSTNPNITILHVQDVSESPIKSSSQSNDIPQVIEAENMIDRIIHEWLLLDGS